MRVQFWGTRGSIAKPGPSMARYGGNTSCIEVRSARGTLVIVDCGTGAHPLGQKLMSAGAKSLRGHILISHTHWDHIQGIPFFAPLFESGNEWDIYGPKGLGESLRETLAGQMEYTYFPLTPDQFGATIRYHDLVEGAFDIEEIKVSTHYLNHPALTLGYGLEADGARLVYCCDHEPHSRNLASGQGDVTGLDLRHAEFIHGADLLIHDAQYTAAEYPAKIGWGHSPVEYAAKLGQHAQVKRLALTHHDPLRDDDAVDRMLEGIRTRLQDTTPSLDVFAAVEGQIIEIEPSRARDAKRPANAFHATASVEPALADRSVLLGIADPNMATTLSDAIRAEGICPKLFVDIDAARRLILADRPSLVILEHDMPRIDGMKMCHEIRKTDLGELPVVMIAEREDIAAGSAAGVTDWLIKPFKNSYARTKIRTWVLRSTCRWIKARIPEDEERRLSSLRNLRILDTKREETFDRITRLAAALFNVPIALVSLVDENRQWFKSCLGLTAQETSRDTSFCAHVVYSREPMIVADALQDSRFADNPLVINDPRIRFYAGYPLILDDGSCIGTLCILDTRPRSLEGPDLARLRDLTDIALQELRAMAATSRVSTLGSPPIATASRGEVEVSRRRD
jgi:phosphoribosyl 1,2-cyclic phosphodiesterase/DNA-binding response OmpR family regulator